MPNIQFAIDLATSVSVLGAAMVFLYTQATESKKARRAAVRAQRIENMSNICVDLAVILHRGDEVVSKVRQAQAGRNVQLDPDDFTNFCIDIDRYIRINTVCSFMVWASTVEKDALKNIAETARSWNANFLKAASDRSRGLETPVPSFDQLIDDIKERICTFSGLVRAEIERAGA